MYTILHAAHVMAHVGYAMTIVCIAIIFMMSIVIRRLKKHNQLMHDAADRAMAAMTAMTADNVNNAATSDEESAADDEEGATDDDESTADEDQPASSDDTATLDDEHDNMSDLQKLHQRFLQLMESDEIYKDPDLSRNEVVKMLGTNRTTFAKMITQCSSYTNFRDYINHYRVEVAVQLLREQPEMSISDIAYAAGFNSRNTFNTNFLKVKGMTPTEYRSNNEQQ